MREFILQRFHLNDYKPTHHDTKKKKKKRKKKKKTNKQLCL